MDIVYSGIFWCKELKNAGTAKYIIVPHFIPLPFPYQIMCTFRTTSPAAGSHIELSHIPVLDVDNELSASMNHMSLHDSLTEAHNTTNSSLPGSPHSEHQLRVRTTRSNHISSLQSIHHESIGHSMHSPPVAGHIDHGDGVQSPMVILPDKTAAVRDDVSLCATGSAHDDCGESVTGLRSAQNTTQSTHSSYASSGNSALSASLFTASYRFVFKLTSLLFESFYMW